MRHQKLFALPLGLLVVVALPTAAQLPYNPTRIFRSPLDDRLLYTLQPSSTSDAQFQLLSLNLTYGLATTNLPYHLLHPTLPFLDSRATIGFTPVLDGGGNITVYTGNCSLGAKGSQIWVFAPDERLSNGNGTWRQETTSPDVSASNGLIGANYLASGISFPSIIGNNASSTSIYVFGGMCPDESSATDSWISSARYSNLMIMLDPASVSSGSIEYDLEITSSRGPPIAEAGFSMTPLVPTFSNHSDGTQTQQQDFLLLGGHTETAFINMSQVALFSLPQQSWTFLPVEQPSTGHTDLTIRDTTSQVGPRSGHTAVLTSDAKSIVLLGGWVGGVDTPADPQLAVLELGEGYGGQGDWHWTTPSTTGTGIPKGSGLYGHGAVMLPGNVMMVTGGYSISGSAIGRRRRAAQMQNTQTYFLNVTSGSWLSHYQLPSTSELESKTSSSGPLSTTSQKVGLGAGLGIGCAAVLGLALLYFWYTRRLKRHRDSREKELRKLALGAHRFDSDEFSGGGVDGRGGNMSAVNYMDNHRRSTHHGYPWAPPNFGSQGWRTVSGHDAERTGLLLNIPSPTRGLRRNFHGRVNAHTAPRYDEKRTSRGSGNIHPIEEKEEEELFATGAGAQEMSEKDHHNRESNFSTAPTLDPFTDTAQAVSAPRPATGRSRSFSEPRLSTAEGRQHGAQTSFDDWERADLALLHDQGSAGRTSPSKSDRTISSLSEKSTHSDLSSRPHTASGTISRTLSTRSAALLSSIPNPFASPNPSPTGDSPISRRSPFNELHNRSLNSTRPNTGAGRENTTSEVNPFAMAPTSLAQLQAEGEALLGGRPDQPHSNHSSEEGPAPTQSSEPSPVCEKPRLGWMGSVRRVLSRSGAGRSVSMTSRIPQYTTTTPTAPDSGTPSPTKPGPSTSTTTTTSSHPLPPRRAASDASPFLRSKRGAKDWGIDTTAGASSSSAGGPRSAGGLGSELPWRRNSGDDWGSPEDVAERARGEAVAAEEDWDVEAAVEGRVVQVLFTVPRTRLRVVNADVDGRSLVSAEGVEGRGE